MLVTFNSDANPSDCSCYEYRQYVRGTFLLDGQVLPHQLPSGPLDPAVFLEDGFPMPHSSAHFGHRMEPGSSDDIYNAPERSTGCEYYGRDLPGIKVLPGESFEIDLEFI